MSGSWLNETALDIVAGLTSNGPANLCTLSTGQMLAIAFLLLALVLGTIAAAIAALWCVLHSEWMCCYKKKKRRKRRVAFDDGESDKKKHRFIEDVAWDGTMIARQGKTKAHIYSSPCNLVVSPRLETCRATTRKVVFQEVVDIHRSRTPSLTSARSSFNPLHRSVSLDLRRPATRIALSSISLNCLQTAEVPRRGRAHMFPIR
ncbi:hypothetical protein PRIPAC_96313 [Pristionchus pacificus]|uniref:Uncharacterized protein n=1 Tax=Pristionchus pacificus TaxID=54126 RepID=A0A2A6BK28_PRIPA|nr:hypothetical protein PRIPAC_96313 [Pristionchus pacificus]|eukprot:PDM66176.1 hypothetical protein PRIPAC_45401 [Pristionchus pacificus]